MQCDRINRTRILSTASSNPMLQKSGWCRSSWRDMMLHAVFLHVSCDRPRPCGSVPVASGNQSQHSKHSKRAKAKHKQKQHALQKHQLLQHGSSQTSHSAAAAVTHQHTGRDDQETATVYVNPLSDQLVALAFKVTHDKRKNPIVVSSEVHHLFNHQSIFTLALGLGR